MVSKNDTLSRLNKEKDYEDQLVYNLNYYFISVLNDIPLLTEEEKSEIRRKLEQIRFDSMRHSEMFNQLVQMVFESGSDKF
ncbi:hypothetical protein JW756_00235 [Candidatus Woesearchaeota archaeon]|nr:hypothetical protein [Candidatus Woesearchaeota archaeon]